MMGEVMGARSAAHLGGARQESVTGNEVQSRCPLQRHVHVKLSSVAKSDQLMRDDLALSIYKRDETHDHGLQDPQPISFMLKETVKLPRAASEMEDIVNVE